ncbi:MAG: porin [Gammaproteobacteria bacterium]|nr:porin [Gammaproteobacteria bacterium]
MKQVSALALLSCLAVAPGHADTPAETSTERTEPPKDARGADDGADQVSLEIHGRIMWDADSYDGVLNQNHDGERSFNAHFRRARLELEGTAHRDFNYYLHVDFLDFGDDSRAEMHTVGLEYVGFEPFDIFVGRTKEPFGLEELSSSKALSSIERNYFTESTTADSQPFYGVRLDGMQGKVGWSAGLFNPNGNPQNDDGSDRIVFTGRVFGAPIDNDASTLHFGLGVTERNIEDPFLVHGFRLDIAESGGELDSRQILTDDIQALGIEGLYIDGPFSIQSEYFVVAFSGAEGGPDGKTRHLYLQGTWTLTGERRGYKPYQGVYDIIEPEGNKGAVELVAKYDHLDFFVDGRPTQRVRGYLIGANWYVNRNVKLMINYVHVDSDNVVVSGPETSDVLSTRVQVAF